MQTVGDQIFALTKQVKVLKARCREYEELLRRLAEGNRASGHAFRPDQGLVGDERVAIAMPKAKLKR